MKRYNRTGISNKWEEVKKDPDRIYHNGQEMFNYTGKLMDIDLPYTEYISELIMRDFYILKLIGKNDAIIRSTKSFNCNHTGISNDYRRQKRFGYTRLNEKTFAVALFNSDYNFPFGKILDYEIPLSENNSSKIGEIDLISKNGPDIYLIELKMKTKETLLRAIMEVFTFAIFLNKRREKFQKDMKIDNIQNIFPTILTFRGSYCETQLNEIVQNRYPKFRQLLVKMNEYLSSVGISPFRFFIIDANGPSLTKDKRGKTVIKDDAFLKSEVIECSPFTIA
jgi:hypothetical protein